MISPQEKFANSMARSQRKLSDNLVQRLGRTVQAFKLNIAEDIYGDENQDPIESVPLTLIIKYPPGGVPLFRYRVDQNATLQTPEVQQTGVFLFDVLPIEMHAKFVDNIAKGDILFHPFRDENQNNTGILLQVSNALGSFTTEVTWIKYLVAPYSGPILPEIQSQLTQILTGGFQ
jgi:hypothetical protein